MSILSIDTSTTRAELAIQTKDSIFEVENSTPNSHIESLDNLFIELLSVANCEAKEIEKILIGSGPGSFTGLRIGYSYAIGLATALQIPLVKYSTLKAYAYSYFTNQDLVVCLADARRGEFFTSIFKNESECSFSELKPVVENKILELEEIQNIIRLESSKDVLFVTDTSIENLPHDSKIAKNIAKGILELASKGNDIDVYELIEVAHVKPDYVREVSALKISER